MKANKEPSLKPKEKEVVRKALIKASALLGLNQKDLSKILGITETTLSRIFNYKADLSQDSKEWELVLIFLRIYRSLDSLFGGFEDQCRLWINSYNQHLSGTPKELMKNIQGLIFVAGYLDAMRGLA